MHVDKDVTSLYVFSNIYKKIFFLSHSSNELLCFKLNTVDKTHLFIFSLSPNAIQSKSR